MSGQSNNPHHVYGTGFSQFAGVRAIQARMTRRDLADDARIARAARIQVVCAECGEGFDEDEPTTDPRWHGDKPVHSECCAQ